MEKDVPSLQMVDLPYEVLTMIFSRLAVSDIFNVFLTCKKFKEVLSHNRALWRKKCSESFVITSHRKYCRKYNEENPYQMCRISSNWRKGYFREMLIAQSQTKYMPWLSLHTEYLLLSTGNALTCYPRDKRGLFTHKQKYLWKLFTPTVKRRGIRTNDISKFVAKDNVLVCGNRDGCMAVYHLHKSYDGLSTPKLQEHIRDCHRAGSVEVSAVECLKFGRETLVVSCSADDKAVKFWRKEHRDWEADRTIFKCIREVNAEIRGAKCMHLNSNENLLALGLDNNSRPLIIETEIGTPTYYCEAYSNMHECVRDIQWIDNNTVAFVTHKGLIFCLDLRCNRVVYSNQDPLGSSLYSLHTDGARALLVGCAQLSRCVLYDLRTHNNFVQMYFTQRCSSPVYSLAFDANVLVAAAERGVGVLNFNVNTTRLEMRDYASMIRNKP